MAEARPIFALDLSNDGITLWHRKGGGWIALGQVALDAPNIRIEIEDLRVKAGITHGNPVKTVVRIPRSEVMMSRLKLGVFEGDAAVSHARKLITALTPYPLNQVVYDLDAKGVGNMAPVAIAARETLQEAETFASQYGFEAVYFTTDHTAREFPREPRFYLKPPRKPILPMLSRVVAAGAVGLAIGYFGYVKFWAPAPEPQPPVAQLEQPALAKPAVSPQPEVALAPPEPTPEPEVAPDFSAPQTATLIAPETTAYPDIVIPDIGRTSLSPIARLARPTAQQGALPPTFQASTTHHKTDALALNEAHRDLPEIALDDDILAGLQLEMALPQVAQNVAGDPLVFAAFTPPDTAYAEMIQSLLVQPEPSYQTPPQDARAPADPPPPPPAAVTAEPGTLIPSPEGTLGPENILIFSGRPQVVSRPRPEIAPLPDPLAGFRPRPRPEGLTPVDLLLSFAGTPAPSQLSPPVLAENGPQSPALQAAVVQNQIPLMALPLPLAAETLPGISGPALSILALADPALAGKKARPRPANLQPVELDETPASVQEPATLLARADPALAGIKARARPAYLAIPKPVIALTEEAALPLLALADPALAGKKPRARPAGLKAAPVVDPQSLIARADPTLSGYRAKKRPSNLKFAPVAPKIEIKPAQNTLSSATRLAIAISPKPKTRPANFANLAARASDGTTKTTGKTPKTAAGTSKPSSSPTTTTVAKAATEKSRFNKRKMSLVGVFGKPSARRALVRMPSGRYVKVKSGDRLSGWRVSAIGASSVRIQKGSKNQILRMP